MALHIKAWAQPVNGQFLGFEFHFKLVNSKRFKESQTSCSVIHADKLQAWNQAVPFLQLYTYIKIPCAFYYQPVFRTCRLQILTECIWEVICLQPANGRPFCRFCLRVDQRILPHICCSWGTCCPNTTFLSLLCSANAACCLIAGCLTQTSSCTHSPSSAASSQRRAHGTGVHSFRAL